MAEYVYFMFRATEVRDSVNSSNYRVEDGEVLKLNVEDEAQERCAERLRVHHGEEFEEIEDPPADATVVLWEEEPYEINKNKQVEEFIRLYRDDPDFRRIASDKGVRVLELGQR